MKSLFAILALSSFLAGCETQFTGDPQFPGGPSGCAQTCAQSGLEMSGYIFSGEYSSACVCRPPHAPMPSVTPSSPAPPPAASELDNDPVEDNAAVVGVMQQMKDRRRQQQSQQNHY